MNKKEPAFRQALFIEQRLKTVMRLPIAQQRNPS
jgi:hypothetical protein